MTTFIATIVEGKILSPPYLRILTSLYWKPTERNTLAIYYLSRYTSGIEGSGGSGDGVGDGGGGGGGSGGGDSVEKGFDLGLFCFRFIRILIWIAMTG